MSQWSQLGSFSLIPASNFSGHDLEDHVTERRLTSPEFGVPTVPTSGQQPAGPSGPSSAREDKAEAAMFLSQLKMWNHL